MMVRTERDRRKRAAYQFELQASKLYLSVQSRLPNYRYIVKDETSGSVRPAVVLASTFDYYEYRLGRSRQPIDLLIVQHHNAAVPISVLCLATAMEYAPGAVPTFTRAAAKRTNHDEVVLLVSKLILDVDSAYEELARMHPRTRQRYLQRRNAYLKPRVGRPQAN